MKQWITSAVGLLSVLALSASAQEPADADLAAHFKVRPNYLSLNSTTHFDDDGQVRSQQENASISLHIDFDQVTPVGYRDLMLTHIKADGKTLSHDDKRSSYVSHFSPTSTQSRQYFSCSLSLPYPPPQTRVLTEISGKLTVQVAIGARKESVLPPIKDILKRRVRIQGLEGDDVWINIRPQSSPNRYQIEMPQRTATLLDKLELVDAAGNELKVNSMGGSSNSSMVTRYVGVTGDDTARFVLKFYEDVRSVEVPFTLRDIALPGATVEREDELVIEAVEVARPVEAAPDEPAADEPAPDDADTLKAVVE